MSNRGLNKLFWGFFFIMINFRIQGFDIFPDIVGYLFLASGISNLISNSSFFEKAAKYNVFMLIFSLFSIYQIPAPNGGIHFGTLGVLGIFAIPIAIIFLILNLLLVYNLFMGIKDMAEKLEQQALADEAEQKWSQYKSFQIAVALSFIFLFIPLLAFVYVIVLFIAAIIITINILGFLRRCSENLSLTE